MHFGVQTDEGRGKRGDIDVLHKQFFILLFGISNPTL